MDKALVFDIWGSYAHYKKIYATTSAISYPIPFKTSIYGYVGALIGLEKENNEYLRHFEEGSCKIALQLINPIVMQRINTNLSAKPGPIKNKRTPTMMEYVYKPKYRIFFWHKDEKNIYEPLKKCLKEHKTFYTPTLGLANLLSNFRFIQEAGLSKKRGIDSINTVIPKEQFIEFDNESLSKKENEIIEISQYALEMDTNRNTTKRDDILLDRKAKSIKAKVHNYTEVALTDQTKNAIFF
jgi:CRISPR-associated protein Cas5h